MRVDGAPHRTIERASGARAVRVLDQTRLPGEVRWVSLETPERVATAIRTMIVRGAPLIGVTAAYGLAISLDRDPSDAGLASACASLAATRPTAINLRWALDRVSSAVRPLAPQARADAAFALADRLAEEDVEACRSIGEHGAALLRGVLADRGGRGPLRVMTHCNAGWLATVDWGTALAPVYALHDAGVPLTVWVSETRPRNQGWLTEWELRQHGVPCTLVADNACGHLLSRGEVDAVIVGSDRTARNGDVCNKVGTYLKALAARAHGVPFFVALPSSTFDLRLESGEGIPIEERDASELGAGAGVRAFNPAFDVTPAHLVTRLVTERGAFPATAEGIASAFPELVG